MMHAPNFVELGWAALAVSLPFLFSLIAMVMHFRVESSLPGHERGESAGSWLERMAGLVAPGLGVSEEGRAALDAYWPGSHTISLSRRTWHSASIRARTIAAHELGHAVSVGALGRLGDVLPLARLVQQPAWRLAAAFLIIGVVQGSEVLASLSWWIALLGWCSSSVIVADEAVASWRADRWLQEDRQTRALVGWARRSMLGALGIYGSVWSGQWLALVLWPAGASDVQLAGAMSGLGAVLVCLLLPALTLRVLAVLDQVLRPEPVSSDFRLFSVMHREAQWEAVAGSAVLLLVVVLCGFDGGPWFALCLALAALTALGPVSEICKAFLLIPIWLLVRSGDGEEEADALFGAPQAAEPPPALMALYSEPPWYLRVSWLSHLAYVPLILWVATSAEVWRALLFI